MKKRNFKKFATLFLALVMVQPGLAGCTKSEPTTNNTETESTTKPEGEQTAEGKTHKFKLLGPESPNPHIKFADREKYVSWKALDEMFKEKGLELEFEIVAQDQYEVTIQTRVASGKDLPDFCNITPLDVATKLNLADSGILLPVNKIIDEHSDGTAKDFFDNQAAFARKSTTAADGNRYWIPSISETTYEGKLASTCMMVAVRKDWLDKLSLPAPTNAEEFVSTMKAFKDKDANGNGVEDEAFAINTAEFANGISSWFGLPQLRITVDTKSGKVVSPWTSPGAKDYFKYINRLIEEGILDKTLIGAQASVVDQLVAENKVGGLFTYAMQTWYEPSIVGVEDALYMPIGPLPAVDGITPVSNIEPSQLSWQGWGITNNCKDLEGMGKLLDVICSDEFATLSSYGIEGTTFEVKDDIKTFIIKQSDWEEGARTGLCAGDSIWGQSMFPKVRFAAMETEINSIEEAKREYQKDVIFYEPNYPNDVNAYLAVPTLEEQERLNEIERDFKTFSQELATDLALGNRSVDDWDQHMKELEEVGFKEVMDIYQARFDRFNQN